MADGLGNFDSLRRSTRSTRSAANAATNTTNQGDALDIPLPPPVPSNNPGFAELASALAVLTHQINTFVSASSSSSTVSNASPPSTSILMAPSRKEADRIQVPKLPGPEHYLHWRYRMLANVVAASTDPTAAQTFVDAITGDAPLGTPEQFTTLDSKLKSALLSALENPSQQSARIMASYATKPGMSGRELFRIFDRDYGMNSHDSLAILNMKLIQLTCSGLSQLGVFLATWKDLAATIAGTPQDLPESTKKVLLIHKLDHIAEVAATLAQCKSTNASYDDLLNALTDFEATHRNWSTSPESKNQGKLLIAGAAKKAASRPFNGIPCHFCANRLRGTGRPVYHTYNECRSKPQPFNGYGHSRNQMYRPTPRVPEFKTGPQSKPANSAVAGVARQYTSPTIDSGATYSIMSSTNPFGRITNSEHLDEPVDLECVGGVKRALERLHVHDQQLGTIQALHVDSSPPLVSMGELINSGFSFSWNADCYDHPTLTKPNGETIKLGVHKNTPILPTIGAAQAQGRVRVHPHNVIHFPKDPECLVCEVTKMKQVPARKKHPLDRDVAPEFLDRVSVDLIEVSKQDVHGHSYIFVMRDDFSGLIGVRPQKSKEPTESLDSFRDIMRNMPKMPKRVRSDGGTEFLGAFEAELKRLYIGREYTLPYRSTTNSRHERLHQEINRGIRSILFQSGLPIKLWSYASRYFEIVFNHMKTDRDTMNPCEKSSGRPCLCYDKVFTQYKCWPCFGSLASYMPARAEHKFDSRAYGGVVVGFDGDLNLQVLDLADLIKGTISLRHTRDVVVHNEEFPARKLGLRSESDLLFYKLLEASERDDTQVCLRCGQLKVLSEPTCPRCTDMQASGNHRRDLTCQLARCRCKHANPVSPDINYWEFESWDDIDQDVQDVSAASCEVTVLPDGVMEPANSHEIMTNTASFPPSSNESEGNLYVTAPKSFSPIPEPDHDMALHADGDIEVSTEPFAGETTNVVTTCDDDVCSYTADALALLTKPVSTKDYSTTPDGIQAIQKELDTMIRNKVWNPEDVIERNEASTVPQAQFVKGKLIMAVKNAEMVGQEKLKARLVAQGCVVKDAAGNLVFDNSFPYECPAGLLSFRLCMFVASFHGCDAAFGDVQGAYLHAPLLGPPTFISLPEAVRPANWAKFRDPVVRLDKALYGMARSGSDFAKYARSILLELGWKQIEIDPSAYTKNSILLMIYVDDVCLAGPKTALKGELEALRSRLDIPSFIWLREQGSTLAPIRYLGMDISVKNDDILVSSEQYTSVVLKNFCEMTGRDELRRAKIPGWETEVGDETTKPGLLTNVCRELVGQIMWLARTTRPDINHAAVNLSTMVDKWSAHSDRCIHRLMQYLSTNKEWCIRFTAKRSSRMDDIKVIVFSDADHGGSLTCTKSTNGFAAFLEHQGKRDLVDWGCKRQSHTATSTTEAEVVAAWNAFKSAIVPLETFVEEFVCSARPAQSMLFIDNQSTIRAIRNGFSPKMRHLSKVHRLALGAANEQLAKTESRVMVYIPSMENVADIFTKMLSTQPFSNLRAELCVKRN